MLPKMADCRCNSFIDENGYGMCQKKDEHFEGAYVCHIDWPSACGDLQDSITTSGHQLSAEACQGNALL